MTKKLDGKATVAGALLLLNAVLWFVQRGLDYAIADGGSWGVGGIVQNYTVVLAEPINFLFVLAMFIAAITLLTRNRIAAVLGLIVLAAYFVYSMYPWDMFTLHLDVIALVLAILCTAIAVAVSGGESKVMPWVATILIVVFAVLHVVGRIINGGYDYGFAGLPVTVIYGLRYFLLALGLLVAARVGSEKKPEGAHWA